MNTSELEKIRAALADIIQKLNKSQFDNTPESATYVLEKIEEAMRMLFPVDKSRDAEHADELHTLAQEYYEAGYDIHVFGISSFNVADSAKQKPNAPALQALAEKLNAFAKTYDNIGEGVQALQKAAAQQARDEYPQVLAQHELLVKAGIYALPNDAVEKQRILNEAHDQIVNRRKLSVKFNVQDINKKTHPALRMLDQLINGR